MMQMVWRATPSQKLTLALRVCARSYCTRRTTTKSLLMPVKKHPMELCKFKSYALMLNAGMIHKAAPGIYSLLPLGLRCVEKLVALVDEEMRRIGGVKMSLPIVTPAALWKMSGRWDAYGSEIFKLKDRRETEYCLGPTHEEVLTVLISEEVNSHNQLPLRLYQIDRKFRDEIYPKFGLVRSRDFLMKDMYTFDTTEEAAWNTYSDVSLAYERIFQRLGLNAVKVKASCGNIGGSLSHEYHFLTSVGGDEIVQCNQCGLASNLELGSMMHLDECAQPHDKCQLERKKGIEIAHMFLLGTKYSQCFGATFDNTDNQKTPCEMGCYGIGISRLLAALMESSDCTDEMMLPTVVSPYNVCIVPLHLAEVQDPSSQLMTEAELLYDKLEQRWPGDVLLENRTHWRISERLKIVYSLGFPVTVIIGKTAKEDRYEVKVKGKAPIPVHKDSVLNYIEDCLDSLSVYKSQTK